MTVVVFGSVNIDITARVRRLPEPGETCHALGHEIGLGGKGANQAVAARRLHRGAVRLRAAIGEDGFGAEAARLLASFGVSTDDLLRDPARGTGLALIGVDSEGRNTITVIAGANMGWPDEGPDPALFDGAQVALFQLETPLAATAAAMAAARQHGCLTVLDPAPAPSADIASLLALADVVTPNETEARALTGILPTDPDSAFEAASALLAQGARAAVVKLGARGAVFLASDGSRGVVEPFKVATVDTVAAGDCFNGALAAALAEGAPLREALDFAAAAAALSTTRHGAAASMPDRVAAEALLATRKQ